MTIGQHLEFVVSTGDASAAERQARVRDALTRTQIAQMADPMRTSSLAASSRARPSLGPS